MTRMTRQAFEFALQRLAEKTFPDAKEVKLNTITHINTRESRKPPRKQLNVRLPGGTIWIVYAGDPAPFGQLKVNGITGTMIDVSLDVTNWDDVVGFLSLARSTFDAAIDAMVTHDETIEQLRVNTPKRRA